MKKVFQSISFIIILIISISLIMSACAPVPQIQGQTLPAPTPKSAVFIASDLTMEPELVSVGDSATVGVTVNNTGDQTGTYPVVLKVNGVIEETRNVTLTAGTGQRVTFMFTPVNPRDYEIMVDELKIFVNVSCDVPG